MNLAVTSYERFIELETVAHENFFAALNLAVTSHERFIELEAVAHENFFAALSQKKSPTVVEDFCREVHDASSVGMSIILSTQAVVSSGDVPRA